MGAQYLILPLLAILFFLIFLFVVPPIWKLLMKFLKWALFEKEPDSSEGGETPDKDKETKT